MNQRFGQADGDRSPLKDLAGIVERATGELKTKLDNYNKERDRDHRQGTEQVGFLSSLWQESEIDSSDIKIRALEENNNDLTQELKNNKRSLQEAQNQVYRLKREKNEWQELYMKTLPAKRSSDDPVPSGDKRCRTEGGSATDRQSSSVEARKVVRREGSRWDVKTDPTRGDLSNRRISEIVINMWKEQCRKINRYIPDRPHSGPNVPYPHGFNHGSNISFLLTAASSYKRLTEGMNTWKEKADFEHEEYLEVIKRNHIPTNKATYQEIRDHPEMALTHRCSPLSHYYIAIVQDSPGYKAKPGSAGHNMSETVSNKHDPHTSPSPSPPPQTISRTYARATSSGNPRKDGRDNTKEKPHFRIRNRDIKFPDPDTLTEEEKTLMQNLNSDVTMIEEDAHMEQYLAWRSKEIARANNWWINGFDQPFWTKGLEAPYSPNDPKLQRRFDIAHIANCETRINRIRLQAFSRPPPLPSDGPSGQGKS